MSCGLRRVIRGVAMLILMGGSVGRARAGPLDPLAFPSLGSFPGGYAINTNDATIRDVSNQVLATGVLYNASPCSTSTASPGASP
jgi:hypothetical protein